MTPLLEDSTTSSSPPGRGGVFRTTAAGDSVQRPLVLPVPPPHGITTTRPLSPRLYPRVDVSHLLRRRSEEEHIYDEVPFYASVKQRSFKSLSLGPNVSQEQFENARSFLRKPSIFNLPLDSRRNTLSTGLPVLPATKRARSTQSVSETPGFKILSSPRHVLNKENTPASSPVKQSYSIRNRVPIPSISVRDLTNVQRTFLPVTPSTKQT